MQKRDATSVELPGIGATVVSRHDGLGAYIEVSEEVEEVLGYTREELIGQASAEWIHPEDMRVVEEAYETAWRLRRPIMLVCRTRSRDGMFHWIVSRFELVKHNGRDEFRAHTRAIVEPQDGSASFTVE